MRRVMVVGLVAAAWVAAVPVADAYQPLWRFGSLGANTKDASSTYPELRASKAWAQSYSYKIDVAAHYPGGWTMYANWTEAWGYACHSYSGLNDLGGFIWNPHSSSQSSVDAYVHYPSYEAICN